MGVLGIESMSSERATNALNEFTNSEYRVSFQNRHDKERILNGSSD